MTAKLLFPRDTEIYHGVAFSHLSDTLLVIMGFLHVNVKSFGPGRGLLSGSNSDITFSIWTNGCT